MITTIIFDLDGTIIDSEPLAYRSVRECTDAWGLNLTETDATFVAGKKWELAFDYLYSKYEFPVHKEEASRVIVNRYKELLKSTVIPVPGAVEAIQDFANHFRIGLVSGSHRAEIEFALASLKVRHHFEVLLGAEDYPESKPSPQGYNKAIQLMGISPGETLIFEDSHPGIASALAAKARVVAISSTNHFKQDQSAAHASIVDFQGVNAAWVKTKFKGAK